MLNLRVNITHDCRSRISVDQDSFLNYDIIEKKQLYTNQKYAKTSFRRILL